MGFGYLLVGYFFVNFMAIYRPFSFAMLVGYGLILAGLYKLAPYHKLFEISRNITFAAFPFAVYYTVFGLSELIGFALPAFFTGTVYTVIGWCYLFYNVIFHIFLLRAIASLTGEIGLGAQQIAAMRNMYVLGVYALFDAYCQLPFAFVTSHAAYLVLPLLLLRLLYVGLNLYLIAKCYRYIQPDGMDYLPGNGEKEGNTNEKQP